MKKILILILPFLLSGCWNYRELNNMAIVSAIAVNKEDDVYKLAVQIMNSKKTSSESGSSNSQSSPITVFQTEGSTIHEALRKVVLKSPRKLYIGHMDLLIIDEQVAYDGLNDILDFFIRDPESRKQFKVIIAKEDEADDLIKIITPLEDLPSYDLIETIRNASKNYGTLKTTTYDEILSDIYSEGKNTVIPAARVYGDIEEGSSKENLASSEPKTNIVLDSLAVFNGDKLAGYLNQEESLGYNFITNNLTYSVISFKCDDEHTAAIEVIKNNSTFDVKIKDGKPFVNINVKPIAFLSEINCAIPIYTDDDIQVIEKMANEAITNIIDKSIKKAKDQLGTDIFGFGKFLYRNNLPYWNKNKNIWYTLFNKIDYKINVNVIIDKKGALLESAVNE